MVDGKTKTRIKTFSNLKNSVNTQDVYDVANSLMALQEHGVLDVCKVDNTSLIVEALSAKVVVTDTTDYDLVIGLCIYL